MPKETTKPNLVEMIATAGPEEMQEIDAQIEERKTKVENLRKEISSLKELRRIIDFRVNGPTKPKPAKSKTKPEKRGGGRRTFGVSPQGARPAVDRRFHALAGDRSQVAYDAGRCRSLRGGV